jgi:hypothetical protein
MIVRGAQRQLSRGIMKQREPKLNMQFCYRLKLDLVVRVRNFYCAIAEK